MIISIIVPVYNVEKYLPKCLDSLLKQGLDSNQYEILIINDGSTDGSGTIANEFAKKHSQIKVIDQENAGLGAARNIGIKHAIGKYIQFVDSDDYLEENVLPSLLHKMDNESLDILRFNYQNVNEKYEVIQSNKKRTFVDYRDEVCDGITFLSERLGYACYVGQFIIKTNLLKIPGNLFKEGIYFEDTEWTPRILVYNYLMRKNSITKTDNTNKKYKLVNDRIAVIDCLLTLKKNIDIVSAEKWIDGMISHLVLSLMSLIIKEFPSEKNIMLNKLRKRELFPLSKYRKTRKQKLWINSLNISPGLFMFLKICRKI
jgi:glycosyltransferase involved in cell wall biosynthesis